jgi:hypothetical protein
MTVKRSPSGKGTSGSLGTLLIDGLQDAMFRDDGTTRLWYRVWILLAFSVFAGIVWWRG